MSSENSVDSPREMDNYDTSETQQTAADREGEAALEETRSIIFLSQIDLASKVRKHLMEYQLIEFRLQIDLAL